HSRFSICGNQISSAGSRGQTLVDITLQRLAGRGIEESQRPRPYAPPIGVRRHLGSRPLCAGVRMTVPATTPVEQQRIAQKIAQQIAHELGVRAQQVGAAVELLDGGATVPFIARYRKEATGALDDAQLRTLEDRLRYLRELEDRRTAILESIREQ